MAQLFRRNTEAFGTRESVIGKNSEAFLRGTPVSIDANGFLIGCTGTEKVYGFCLEDITMASNNQTVAQYKPQVANWDGVQMAFTTIGALAQTDIGEYSDVSTNTAGAVVLTNPAAGNSGEFLCVGIDADDSTIGYFVVAEPQDLAFAQA